MEKVLLFLYPIQEFFQTSRFTLPEREQLFNKTLKERYRNKNYKICFVTFPDKRINIDVEPNDLVITTDISFVSHTTPIGKDENNQDLFRYPSEENISTQLGQVDELVVCGFHAFDCVKRVANHFYNKGIDTLVDIELTDLFVGCQNNPLFNPSTYNLANYLEYCKANDLYLFGKSTFYDRINELYNEAFYKKDSFRPTATTGEIIDLIKEGEQFNKSNRRK
ncbi:MAG: primase-like DNA-binding domain-containing protein [Bacilli bacterium]|nr:primase-like DNA-binding domain-containing protein [Bacilli bacterium]MDD3304627.1 primase-like DNA-binding domain-containing protein [Bacilli bacterium]MDD4053540.1 primase-like DNA-binding domain-containing protein [Bacilli bacterium]MDD4411493.1 primase-like DNA-binding domain-containing protein [Bacilli bacterium]